MLCEEFLQDDVILLALLVERQVDLVDDDIGIVVFHIVTESRFPVLLLLRGHIAVAHLLHQHDFLFLRCEHHQHAGCKIARRE